MKEKIQASSRVRGSNIDIVKLYYFSKKHTLYERVWSFIFSGLI